MFLKDVGFVGLAGSGKDEAAKILTQLGWKQQSFAAAVKKIAFEQFGWSRAKDAKGRKLLQDLGMAGREYKESLWIDKARNELRASKLWDDRIVWTDCRFENELAFLRAERQALIIQIVRPGLKADDHISESGQIKLTCDAIVRNDGSIEDLHKKIIDILNGKTT